MNEAEDECVCDLDAVPNGVLQNNGICAPSVPTTGKNKVTVRFQMLATFLRLFLHEMSAYALDFGFAETVAVISTVPKIKFVGFA